MCEVLRPRVSIIIAVATAFAVIKNMYSERKVLSCIAVYSWQRAQVLAFIRLQWYDEVPEVLHHRSINAFRIFQAQTVH